MPYEENRDPPMFTYAMLAVFAAFFAAQFKEFDLTQFHAFPWRVADGQMWRLITCTFLHGSVIHILFNASMFFRFSPVIDHWLGPWGALLVYVLAASSSNAMQLLVSNGSEVIGASGVVYGMFGFLWVMARRRDDAAGAANKYMVETMLAWLGVCAVLNMFGGNIGNAAHIWGLVVGWLLGQCFVARKKWRLALIAAFVVAWALPIALTYRPIWERTMAHLPTLGRRYESAVPPIFRPYLEKPDRQRKPNLFM